MLHELPVTNIRLRACPVAAEQLKPVAGGHFCADCQRVVHDFTRASAADLMQAQASAADGRVCGRFRVSQLTTTSKVLPRLQPRLRQFLLAAVLILVQGMSARQAWAQTQRRALVAPFRPPATEPLFTLPQQEQLREPPAAPPNQPEQVFSGYVEQMPVFPGGLDGLMHFLRANMHYPDTTLEGKVFVRFTVAAQGRVRQVGVVKSLHPLFDAEAVRVVGLMPPWTPGTQNGRPVDVQYTLPITFRLDDAPRKKGR